MEKIKLLEVQSQRLYFRRLRATDLELASCVLQNAETMAAWDRPYDRSDTLDFIADMLRRYRTDGIGCIVRSEKRFHGFGRECLSAMLSCAFARLELDRVVSFIRLDNVGALQTAAAFGMKPVGRCERVHAGQAVPHAVLEMRNPLAAPDGIN